MTNSASSPQFDTRKQLSRSWPKLFEPFPFCVQILAASVLPQKPKTNFLETACRTPEEVISKPNTKQKSLYKIIVRSERFHLLNLNFFRSKYERISKSIINVNESQNDVYGISEMSCVVIKIVKNVRIDQTNKRSEFLYHWSSKDVRKITFIYVNLYLTLKSFSVIKITSMLMRANFMLISELQLQCNLPN